MTCVAEGAGRVRTATWQWMPARWSGQVLRLREGADGRDKAGLQFPKRMGRRRKTPPMSGSTGGEAAVTARFRRHMHGRTVALALGGQMMDA